MNILEGLKVLDFSTLLPAYVTTALADMGADVLKIVSKSRPDVVMVREPHLEKTQISASGAWISRGKKSMFVNLKTKEGIEIIKKLVSTYDILVEQYRPGVMDKLGLGYDALKEINPRLIYCSITGYGQDGPLRDRAGHDINCLSLSGLMGISGRKNTGPVLTGTQITDVPGAANHAMIGILAAAFQRERTGSGQYIDVSMFDGAVAFNLMCASDYLATGIEEGREQFLLNGGSLYDFYETRDGKYMSVGCVEDKFFRVTCDVLGMPEFREGGIFPKDVKTVKDKMRARFQEKTQEEWIALFSKVDACVEPVLSLGEALESELVRSRSMVIEVEVEESGEKVRQLGFPIKFQGQSLTPKHVGKPEGWYTDQVIRELGYTEEELSRLHAEHVLE